MNNLWSKFTFWEKKMVRIKIYGSALPAYFVGITNTPAHGIEHGHDNAACKNNDPTE